MRCSRLTLMFSLILMFLSSCEKGEVPGVSYEIVDKEMLLGGWKISSIDCYIIPTSSTYNSLSYVKDNLRDNLLERTSDASLYFAKDTVYYIETPEPGVSFVRQKSAYYITQEPAILHLENNYLVCDAYAAYYYLKIVDGKLCMYLTKSESLKLMEEDGSISDWMNIIKSIVSDAQFEFYMEPNYLPFYDEL